MSPTTSVSAAGPRCSYHAARTTQVEGSPDADHLDRDILGTTVYVAPNPAGLHHLLDLMSQSVITARIHSRHSLEDGAEVHRLLATKGLIGKILITP